jgi:hypothetical protein
LTATKQLQKRFGVEESTNMMTEYKPKAEGR